MPALRRIWQCQNMGYSLLFLSNTFQTAVVLLALHRLFFTSQNDKMRIYMFPMPPKVQTNSISNLFTFKLLILSITAVVLCGCSGKPDDTKKTGTVSGKITANGQPVTAGIVSISSDALGGASGNLKEDGTYAIEGELSVGSYKVYLTGPEIRGKKDKQGNAIPVVIGKLENVPKKYQDPKSSDLTAEIKEGDNEINFELK